MSPQRSWPAEPSSRVRARMRHAFLSARGVGLVGPFWELVERIIAPVRLAADDPRYSQERAAGEAMSLDEAAEYALSVARQHSERAQGGETAHATARELRGLAIDAAMPCHIGRVGSVIEVCGRKDWSWAR